MKKLIECTKASHALYKNQKNKFCRDCGECLLNKETEDEKLADFIESKFSKPLKEKTESLQKLSDEIQKIHDDLEYLTDNTNEALEGLKDATGNFEDIVEFLRR